MFYKVSAIESYAYGRYVAIIFVPSYRWFSMRRPDPGT